MLRPVCILNANTEYSVGRWGTFTEREANIHRQKHLPLFSNLRLTVSDKNKTKQNICAALHLSAKSLKLFL